ncbi:MAG: DUF1254 domain-containing protein, partial [Thermoanaerobaculia bacterium]
MDEYRSKTWRQVIWMAGAWVLVVTGLIAVGCAPQGSPESAPTAAAEAEPAQPTQMKMTTAIPESITTPDRVETSIGTFEFFDGVPTKKSTEMAYDFLDKVNAYKALLSTIPTVSINELRRGQAAVGAKTSNQICIYDTLMDSKSLVLTGNTSTMYALGFLDLEKDGPTVIELPPGMLGVLNDMGFLHMTDLGAAGPDKGKGGKYLVLPPGYEGDVPKGYFVVQSKTYNVWNFMRGYLDKGVKAASDNIRNNLKVYPLSRAADQPTMEFINVSGKEMNTVLPTDYTFFERINEVVQKEPEGFLDLEVLGLLRSIGIVKGQPFNPDARMKAILTDAAAIAEATARTITYYPRVAGQYAWGDMEGAWVVPFADNDSTWIENSARKIENQIYYHYNCIVVTPAMAAAPDPGKGSEYVFASLDTEKKILEGSKSYKMTLPANVPVADFWAITLYDTQTRSQLQTDQQFPTLDTYTEGLQKNEDGSYTIYFGPEAPAGQESNWLQTIPGKSFFVSLRMYGPTEPWIEGAW